MWAEIVAAARDVVGDWSEDQIAAVIRKVRASTPDDLMPSIGRVFDWCARAMRSGDGEAIATVELWQMPDMPIAIFADEDGVSHALDVDKEAP
jgi:hypothetical protein